MIVPDRLSVVVGVDVNKTRRDDLALGVDFLAATAIDLSDGYNPSIRNSDVAFVGRGTAAVYDQTVADNDVETVISCALDHGKVSCAFKPMNSLGKG